MRIGRLKQGFLKIGLYLLLSSLSSFSFSQYILNGSASQNSCNCYTLTPAQFNQTGSVWNANKINLNNPFDFTFNVYLGCLDVNGADGIVFILQPISTSLGTVGGGMGFEGISPSIGIALDTWQNTINNDPAYDHISIQANGVITHGADLAGPVQALAGNDNIEDCQWHTFRITWDPVSRNLSAYFDGMLRVQTTIDLIATIFSNDPLVYWGFTSATGGAHNLQQFCTALNPDFTTNFAGNATCIGTPVSFLNQSVSFAPIQSYYWDFADGTTSTLQTPPPHLYSTPGIYEVKLVITGLDGCVSDTLKKNIAIGSKPVAAFQVFDTCAGKPPRILDLSTNSVGAINQWSWLLNGALVSGVQQPVFTGFAAGTYQMRLAIKSVYGCESDTVSGTFTIKPAPVVDITASDGCVGLPVNFTGTQLDNITTIAQWNWDFGDGSSSQQQNPVHIYTPGGIKTVRLNATDNNGCTSADVAETVSVASIDVMAMKDTIVVANIPFRVGNSYWSSSRNGLPSFLWSPPIGLDNPNFFSPIASLQDDITYVVTGTTSEGCTDRDTVNIKVFKGSAIYVPSGFTPNKDGRNDILRPIYIGIKKVDFFRVYNRWGQLVYSSNSLSAGWDGSIRGIPQQTGTFVWMLRAEDIAGKIYEMQGTSTIIR